MLGASDEDNKNRTLDVLICVSFVTKSTDTLFSYWCNMLSNFWHFHHEVVLWRKNLTKLGIGRISSLLCWHDSEKRNENPPDIEFGPTLTWINFEVQRSEFQIVGHGFPFDSHQVLSLKLNQNQTLRKVKIRCINVHHCLLLLKDEVAFNFSYHSSILAGFVLFGNLYSCLHSL